MADLFRETRYRPLKQAVTGHCGCQDRLAACSRRNPESCLRCRQLHLPMPSAVPGVVGHTPRTCPQAGSASFSVDLRRLVPWFRVAHRPAEGPSGLRGGFSDRTASRRTCATEVPGCAWTARRPRRHRFCTPDAHPLHGTWGSTWNVRSRAAQFGARMRRAGGPYTPAVGQVASRNQAGPGHPPCPVQPQICAVSIARPPASQPISGSARRPAPVSQHLRRPTVTASARLAH
jgi:hypothetical protein